MIIRYSTCHFSPIMEDLFGAIVSPRCSYCGEKCQTVPQPHTLEHDLELTLRRWKDGDCTLDDMFDRVNKELERSWLEAFGAAAHTLQVGKPKFVLKPGMTEWQEVEATDTAEEVAS